VTISAEGLTTLTYFGTDNAGNVEQAKTLTVQIDKTPLVISGMPAPGCALWPPNHKLVAVTTVAAADALSGVVPGSFQLTGTSNEPSDPNNPDVVIAPNSSGGFAVQLRAERLGSGTGRTYTLNATAIDLAGNTATSTAVCVVPRTSRTSSNRTINAPTKLGPFLRRDKLTDMVVGLEQLWSKPRMAHNS